MKKSKSFNKTKDIRLPKLSLERLERLPQRKLAYVSLLISVTTIFLVLLLKNHLPPEVPLFYGLPVSEEQLVTATELTLPSIFAISIISLNLLLALLIDDQFLRYTMILAGFAVSFFSTLTTLKIIFLVGSF